MRALHDGAQSSGVRFRCCSRAWSENGVLQRLQHLLLPKFCSLAPGGGETGTNQRRASMSGMNILTLNRAANREPNRYPGYSELTLYTSSHGGVAMAAANAATHNTQAVALKLARRWRRRIAWRAPRRRRPRTRPRPGRSPHSPTSQGFGYGFHGARL